MKITLSTLLAFALVLTSCSDYPGDNELEREVVTTEPKQEEEEEVDKTPIEVSWEQLRSGEIKSGQVIIIEGYIEALPAERTDYGGDNATFSILSRRNERSSNSFLARVSIPLGTEKNQYKKLGTEYYHSDLKVTTNTGDIAGVSSRVKVIGTFDTGIFPDRSCGIDLMKVTLIEESPSDIKSTLEEAIELTDEAVKREDSQTTYFYMDARLTADGISAINAIWLMVNIESISNSDVRWMFIQEGYWNGTAQLNDERNKLEVLDIDGNTIRMGSKVRLYGMYRKGVTSTSPGSFHVEEVVKR